MRVISPGWGRTGTTSLAAALTRLGAGPCLQMNDMWARPEVASLFVDGNPRHWATELGEWGSTVEWPGCWIWRELAEAFPEAPLLLTNRDPDEWFDSVMATIHRDTAPGSGDGTPAWALIDRIWREDFGGYDLAADRAHATAAFVRHYEEVRAAYPDRVIEWNVADGWAPLCEALGEPVPDEPFPRLWTREVFG